MDTQKSEEQRNGRFSQEDLISLMDELCIVIGQVLVNFKFLHESILDQAASQQTQEKISKLQGKLADCERRRRRRTGRAVSKPYSGVNGRFGHKKAGGFRAAGDGEV